jgi:hypothetical protein
MVLDLLISASDPDGDIVTLSVRKNRLPMGATFTAAPGNPATGRFTWVPRRSQAGKLFTVNFVAADNGSPALTATESVRIGVGQYPFPNTSTDPNNPDTDHDSFSDGNEVAAGSDPLDPENIPPGL